MAVKETEGTCHRHSGLVDIISVPWWYGIKPSTVLQLPGHFSVHEALLQSVCQPLVHQRVANESSAFSQRCSELKTNYIEINTCLMED